MSNFFIKKIICELRGTIQELVNLKAETCEKEIKFEIRMNYCREMKMMKKVLVKAYVQTNLGDDLFLDILFKRYPDVLFYLEAPRNYIDIFASYKNVHIIEQQIHPIYYKYIDYLLRHFFPPIFKFFFKEMEKKKFRKISFLNDIDGFVLIGGSVFMQPKFLAAYNDIEYYKFLPKLIPGLSMFFLGGNFGPYSDLKYFEGFKEIFKNATDVCFREKHSYELFYSLKNIRFASDIVFSARFQNTERKNNTVGFSVISPENRSNLNEDIQNIYYEKNAQLISKFIQDGKMVYLFSFCQKEGDEKAISKILEKVDSIFINKIEICTYRGNIQDFINVYSTVEQMFCGRFHSIILSLLFDQTIFPVIYSTKMTNVLEDLGYKGSMINIENLGSIDYEVVKKQMINNRINIDEVKNSAEYQFEELDKFLN